MNEFRQFISENASIQENYIRNRIAKPTHHKGWKGKKIIFEAYLYPRLLHENENFEIKHLYLQRCQSKFILFVASVTPNIIFNINFKPKKYQC